MLTTHFTRKVCIGLALALTALTPRIAAQNTWYVDDDGSPMGNGTPEDPFSTIQRAMTAPGTASGDTIRVRPGIYRERVDFTRSVNLISEAGPTQTIIDAVHRGSVVTIRNRGSWESRLEGFTLVNGTGRYNPIRGESLGGGLFCVNSRVSIVDCTLSGNSTRVGGRDSALAGRGGGLYVGPGAEVVLDACTISENDAVDGGGAFLDRSRIAISGGTVQGNRALGAVHPGRGGGLLGAAGSRLDLANVAVQGNFALGGPTHDEALGGGIRLEAGSRATVTACLIESNECGGPWSGFFDRPGYGGGISSMARAADFTMTDTVVRGNRANYGGGLHGKGQLERCTIEDNIVGYGGGGGVEAIDVTLVDCVLAGNFSSEACGGGISVRPGRFASLEHCEIASNYARPRGGGGLGGIYLDCDIHDNKARGDGTDFPVGGGGVFGGELVDCRVWDNLTDDYEDHHGQGGGLYGGSALRTVFYDNFADFEGGGAVFAVLDRCTVAFNWSGAAGCTVHDSIVRFNTLYDTGGSNVTWSNVPAGTFGVGNIAGDPMFVDAPGRDFRLQAGSPCIDAGDPTSSPDPDGSRADMGAIPFGG